MAAAEPDEAERDEDGYMDPPDDDELLEAKDKFLAAQKRKNELETELMKVRQLGMTIFACASRSAFFKFSFVPPRNIHMVSKNFGIGEYPEEPLYNLGTTCRRADTLPTSRA